MPEQFDAEYWESRYSSDAMPGPRPPNPQLVAEAAPLPPGTALDAGCGEGGNAIWLAEQGWRVTAVDVSATALHRARGHAESHGRDVVDRVEWMEADLTAWEPPRERFDLVTAHYVHPSGPKAELLRRLAGAVAPGGTLLVVDHDHGDEHAQATTTADELTAGLDARDWVVVVAETRVRRDAGHHGHGVTHCDVVVRADRRV